MGKRGILGKMGILGRVSPDRRIGVEKIGIFWRVSAGKGNGGVVWLLKIIQVALFPVRPMRSPLREWA